MSIMVAARTVFLREGHAGLSMRMVAVEAGIALGNLSYYFPSKRSLLEAMLQEELADYVDAHLREVSGEEQSALAILLNVVTFYIANARQSHQFFLQMWGYAASDPNARELVRNLYRPIGRFILALVKEANPGLSEMRARQIVLQIFSLEEGVKLFIALGADGDTALETAESDMRDLVRRIVQAG
ncbi:MAG: TetR/AcrR family transcriptional regulator [Parvularculaceae bacterium]|nr:TetR/AcrR family transcriptional regulator [Parvularculaceae bacterium]